MWKVLINCGGRNFVASVLCISLKPLTPKNICFRKFRKPQELCSGVRESRIFLKPFLKLVGLLQPPKTCACLRPLPCSESFSLWKANHGCHSQKFLICKGQLGNWVPAKSGITQPAWLPPMLVRGIMEYIAIRKFLESLVKLPEPF